jgi:hypothetical protein
MAIFIGTNNVDDANFIAVTGNSDAVTGTSNATVVKKVHVSPNTSTTVSQIWPLYEFSIFGKGMIASNDNIVSAGSKINFGIRSSDDSWYRQLGFDLQHYNTHSSTDITKTSTEFLNYDAINYQYGNANKEYNNKYVYFIEASCQDKDDKGNLLHTITGNIGEYKLNGLNSQTATLVPTSQFNIEQSSKLLYQQIGENKQSSCSNTAADCNIQFTVHPNYWFHERSGYVKTTQYDEDGKHVTETDTTCFLMDMMTKNHFHSIVPSDNNPTFYFHQLSNAWSTDPKDIQTIDLEIDGGTAAWTEENIKDNVEFTVTWKIYRNTTAGKEIYYGANIANNNGNLGDETYSTSTMWLTSSNSSCILNDDATKTIDDDGVVTWTQTGYWLSNHPRSCTSTTVSHDTSLTYNPSNQTVGSSGGTVNVTLECLETTTQRTSTIAVHINKYGNWLNQKSSEDLIQSGMSKSYTVSDSISFSALTESSKEYYIDVDSSGLNDDGSGELCASLYWSTGSVNGGSKTKTLYCGGCDSQAVTARAYQSGISAEKGSPDNTDSIKIACTGSETLTSKDGSNYCWTIDKHSETEKGTITISWEDSNGNTLVSENVEHVAGVTTTETITRRIFISTEQYETVKEAINDNGVTSYEISAKDGLTGTQTYYCYIIKTTTTQYSDNRDDSAVSVFDLNGEITLPSSKIFNENRNYATTTYFGTFSFGDVSKNDDSAENKNCICISDTDNITIDAGSITSFNINITYPTQSGGYTKTSKITCTSKQDESVSVSFNISQNTTYSSSSITNTTNPYTGNAITLKNSDLFGENGFSIKNNNNTIFR